MDECCIKGCDKKAIALGLCNKHWRRNRLYGSPAVTKRHSGMYIGMPAEERFFSRVVKQPSGCWEWAGAKDRDGYGIFKGKVRELGYNKAHRFSFAWHKEDIPKGIHVCHTCDNPKCVNPDHLWLGTNLQNMRDKIAKNRHHVPTGESNGHAKLTQVQAQAILLDPRPYAAIALDYNVVMSTVGNIKNRDSWLMLEGEGRKAKRISPRRGVSDKFTPSDIIHIRTCGETGKALATKYNVSEATICDIRKGRSWQHIKEV